MYGGFCYFNNAAITAEAIARETGAHVSILDLDYHHGNGTEQIFWRRGDVLYVSLHAHPDRQYPYVLGWEDETGEGEGEGANLNIPLPAGTTDEQYLAALERGLARIADEPGDIVVVSLGFDTYGKDPICDFALTTPVYHECGRRVAALGKRLVDPPGGRLPRRRPGRERPRLAPRRRGPRLRSRPGDAGDLAGRAADPAERRRPGSRRRSRAAIRPPRPRRRAPTCRPRGRSRRRGGRRRTGRRPGRSSGPCAPPRARRRRRAGSGRRRTGPRGPRAASARSGSHSGSSRTWSTITDRPASASEATIRCIPSTSRCPSSPVSIRNGACRTRLGGHVAEDLGPAGQVEVRLREGEHDRVDADAEPRSVEARLERAASASTCRRSTCR